MAVQIIVDSSADYEVEELEQKQLHCVPLTVTFGEKHYKDCLELTKDEFYRQLLAREHYPKTAQPSPEDFLKVYMQAKEKGDSVVALLLSGGLSGTYQSGCLAKDLAEYDPIYVVDTLSAVAGIRFMAEKAIAMRDAGSTAEEIAAEMERLKKRVRILLAVDTLEYLYKGGRMTKAQTGIAELARLKPIITLNAEGKLEVWKKCIGAKKAMASLAQNLGQVNLDPAYEPVFIYSHDQANCENFRTYLGEKGFNVADRPLYNLGSTIGAHIGSGSFGYVYIEK